MKTPILLFSIIFASSFFCFINANAQNLVINGNAEIPPYDTATPYGWVNIIGNWVASGDSDEYVSPEDGTHLFVEGADSVGVLQQDVDVSSYAAAIDLGTKPFYFSGYVRCYDQDPTDQSAFYVQCLDQSKSNVLSNFYSDTISSVGAWYQVTYSFIAPVNTRFIRIQLVATRRDGSDNDGYFDNITLSPGFPANVQNTQALENEIKVYPVPAMATLNVQLPAELNNCNIKLVNAQGSTVQSIYGKGLVNIDVHNIPNGYYILLVNNEGLTMHKAITIVH